VKRLADLTMMVLAAVSVGLPRLYAQTEPRLAQSIRLAQEGLGDSARTIVQQVIKGLDPSDTLYPQALYARAVVGANPQDMRRDLQRVAVEYSSSSWADDALLRLAQLDYAIGALEPASRDLEGLRLDYSGSPLYAQAALWAARVYFDLRRPPAACRWLAEGLARSGNDVELRNQLTYYQPRCDGVTTDTASTQAAGPASAADSAKPVAANAPRADSTASPADSVATHRPVSSSSSGPSAFRIQVAAVNTEAAADSIAKRVKAAGFDAIVASEKGLFKIRVGAYASRAQAQAALPKIQARLGGKPFVVAPS